MAAVQPVVLPNSNMLHNAATNELDITSLKSEADHFTPVELERNQAVDVSTEAPTKNGDDRPSPNIPAEHEKAPIKEKVNGVSKVIATEIKGDVVCEATDMAEPEPRPESKPESSTLFDIKSRGISAVKPSDDKVKEKEEEKIETEE